MIFFNPIKITHITSLGGRFCGVSGTEQTEGVEFIIGGVEGALGALCKTLIVEGAEEIIGDDTLVCVEEPCGMDGVDKQVGIAVGIFSDDDLGVNIF